MIETTTHELKALHIQKRYKKRTVLRDLSLQVRSGEAIGLLGPNGAGKTSFFYTLVGLLPPDAGQIELDGQDITALPLYKRANYGISYLPQESSIFKSLSVEQNITAALETSPRVKLSKKQRVERCNQLIEEMQLSHVRQTLGMSLSGGERRRAEIARALAIDPIFILLDEPFAGVDPIAITEIQKLITELKQRGLGVIITDHNVRETLSICDRAYILAEGHIIAEGTPRNLLNHPKVRQHYLGENFSL